jgi:predicted GNAT family acetyltransferase
MLVKLEVHDRVLAEGLFRADEVQFNLIHRICESKSSTCLKSSDGTMIFAQSEGHNAWLWITQEAAADKRNAFVQELIDVLEGVTLKGICGEPQSAERFAQVYSKARGTSSYSHMNMEAYYCPEVEKPLNVVGTIHRAAIHQVEIVAEFMAGFSEGAYGISVDPASQMGAAKGAIESGNIYLWTVEGHPVSMANIAHRSPRHARINAVYTPSALRKKGYASALVAELCSILETERLVPMLYADLKNPDSNKVYKNIGFVESGKIADIKFK